VAGVLLTCATLGVVSCGGGAAASGTGDPIEVVNGYMQAVSSGGDGHQYLQTDINDGIPLADGTPASRYLKDHKGAKWSIVEIPWEDPATHKTAPNKKQCTVLPPQGGELCIVTVEVASGSSKVWFHFDVENRYPPGKWVIVGVTVVNTKPEDGLPTGPESHSG
jgi:hypothetical protein